MSTPTFNKPRPLQLGCTCIAWYKYKVHPQQSHPLQTLTMANSSSSRECEIRPEERPDGQISGEHDHYFEEAAKSDFQKQSVEQPAEYIGE